MSFNKWTSIGGFHNVRAIQAAYPDLFTGPITYRGKVKLHGTCAGICIESDGTVKAGEATKGDYEYHKKYIGPYLGWGLKDVKKDIDSGEVELPEGCDWKLVNKPLSNRMRNWYITKCEEL